MDQALRARKQEHSGASDRCVLQAGGKAAAMAELWLAGRVGRLTGASQEPSGRLWPPTVTQSAMSTSSLRTRLETCSRHTLRSKACTGDQASEAAHAWQRNAEHKTSTTLSSLFAHLGYALLLRLGSTRHEGWSQGPWRHPECLPRLGVPLYPCPVGGTTRAMHSLSMFASARSSPCCCQTGADGRSLVWPRMSHRIKSIDLARLQ